MVKAQIAGDAHTRHDDFVSFMQRINEETDSKDTEGEPDTDKMLGLFQDAQEKLDAQAEQRLRLQERLTELENMTDGWRDGKGRAPTSFAVGNAELTMRALLEAGAPTGRLYPQEDGGVQAEWSLPDQELSVSFGRDQGAYIHSVDTAGERTQHYYSSRRDPDEAAQMLLSLGLQDIADDIGQLLRRWEQENSRFGASWAAQETSTYRELLRRPREQMISEALGLLAMAPSLTLLALLDDICDEHPAEEQIGLIPAAHAWMQWGREQGLLDSE